jgi:hypothetical protein
MLVLCAVECKECREIQLFIRYISRPHYLAAKGREMLYVVNLTTSAPINAGRILGHTRHARRRREGVLVEINMLSYTIRIQKIAR